MDATTTLPELTGTPKQIEWATGLRIQWGMAARQYLSSARSQLGSDPAIIALLDRIGAELEAEITDRTSAAAWIEVRGKGPSAARRLLMAMAAAGTIAEGAEKDAARTLSRRWQYS